MLLHSLLFPFSNSSASYCYCSEPFSQRETICSSISENVLPFLVLAASLLNHYEQTWLLLSCCTGEAANLSHDGMRKWRCGTTGAAYADTRFLVWAGKSSNEVVSCCSALVGTGTAAACCCRLWWPRRAYHRLVAFKQSVNQWRVKMLWPSRSSAAWLCLVPSLKLAKLGWLLTLQWVILKLLWCALSGRFVLSVLLEVYLVGAGPGSLELLTLRALEVGFSRPLKGEVSRVSWDTIRQIDYNCMIDCSYACGRHRSSGRALRDWFWGASFVRCSALWSFGARGGWKHWTENTEPKVNCWMPTLLFKVVIAGSVPAHTQNNQKQLASFDARSWQDIHDSWPAADWLKLPRSHTFHHPIWY